jgi:AcrR family transcriptional regulator
VTRTAPAGKQAPAGGGLPPDEVTAGATTKDRILDVALDLFADQGFDGTSVRQIAERVGTTKAALYYYFASKDEILMALHMRLHELGQELTGPADDAPMSLEAWNGLLVRLMEQIAAHRKLFLLHMRNQAAFEKLHRDDDHEAAHDDLQTRIREILADPRVPLRDRVRMAGAFGVLFANIFLYGDSLSASDEEMREALAEAIHDVLGTSR